MAEVIQFNCPVCGTLLRLPLAMAAQQGPCPQCRSEIIAPDPHSGIGASEAVPPVLAEKPKPPAPFAETPPAVPETQEPLEIIPEPEPVKPTPPVAAPPPRGMMGLACLFAGMVGMAMGYALGVRSSKCSAASAAAMQPLEIVPKVETVVAPVVTENVTPPAPPEPPPLVKVSAAAEASLRAFLEAPDWAARSAHVLFPEKTRSALEAYSRETPDGPTAFKSIAVKQSQIDEATGNTLLVFSVTTAQHPGGIPVAIQETPGGWLVDWATFVEFRDGLFEKFAEGPAEKTGTFHLILTLPPPDRAANTANESFSSYLLQSPLSAKARLAYVKKSTPLAATLEAHTMNGQSYAPVLEVIKRTTPDKRDYLEILAVKADDWIPRGN